MKAATCGKCQKVLGRGGEDRHAALLFVLDPASRTSPASPSARSRRLTPSMPTSTRSTSSCAIRACSAGNRSQCPIRGLVGRGIGPRATLYRRLRELRCALAAHGARAA